MSDFKSALTTVGPSMQRGFQVQVEKMNWDDVGGLEDVKRVSKCLQCIVTKKLTQISI